MDYVFFFDTNILCNKDLNSFFGEEQEMKELAKLGRVIIPLTVMMEIEFQKKSEYETNKQKLTKNGLFKTLCNVNDLEIDIDNKIQELKDTIQVEYEVVDITNTDLEDIRLLAIRKEPPFEKEFNTDKGFKDACIFYTILDWKTNNLEKNIVVFSKDKLLKKALEGKKIIVYETIQEFIGSLYTWNETDEKNFIKQYCEQDNISLYLEEVNIQNIEIEDKKLNTRNQWEVTFSQGMGIFDFKSKEILYSRTPYEMKTIQETIWELSISSNFASTHTIISRLRMFDHFLDSEIEELLSIRKENWQVGWIKDDWDIRQFYSKLEEMKNND